MESLVVPHAPTSAALVRHQLIAELVARHAPGTLVDDAAVVVSELVGNAVRHGVALPGGGLIARWDLAPDGLRVEVVDGGPGPGGFRTTSSRDAEGGRGLELVEALAARWGSTPARPGTVVWAELPAVLSGEQPAP